MSIGHWLKGATRIRFDDRTAGNLLKNGAVVGGTIVGGPVGLAIGGLGSAAGQKALGGTWNDSLHAGLTGAANTGLAQAGKGLVTKALAHGAPAVASSVPSAGSSVANAGTDTVAHGALSLPTVPNLTTVAEKAADPRGFLSQAIDTGKGVGSFLGDHDNTAAAVFNGLGNAFDHTDEDQRRAETAATVRRSEQEDYDFNQKKARDLALEPLRQALYGSLGQIGNNYAGIAKNPYVNGGA